MADVGIDKRESHEAPQIRDAEARDPGVVRRTIDADEGCKNPIPTFVGVGRFAFGYSVIAQGATMNDMQLQLETLRTEAARARAVEVGSLWARRRSSDDRL
ncbi:hypothetical protein L6654_38235 [Bradyrhizobium sp. WYCCWR 13023]|uniref:Uncharacterized protein n=1 Tax=Bradyrhizobium zhengyangense TaxID=2911009 RepID=A0A9X1RDT8_9BRAD|nr:MULTISPECIES: hypothetical protein [Bradyrhizobium]MCG2632452.1 hypothetical protein [Bradyrhizobium zhengyangense]